MSAPSSPITTKPPLVHFTRDFVQPPTPLYLDRDDRLHICSWNTYVGAVVMVRGRILTPDGAVQTLSIRHVPRDDRLPAFEAVELTEGFLLGLSAQYEYGWGHYGDTFLNVGLSRGSVSAWEITQPLISGYVGGTASIAWPYGRYQTSLEGPGRIYYILGTNVPPGGYFMEVVPTNARWRLRGFEFFFTTDATVADRLVTLVFDAGDAVSRYLRMDAHQVHPASTGRLYTAGAFGYDDQVFPWRYFIPIPPDIILPQGHRITCSVLNFQLGDNFDAPKYCVEEWLEE